MSTFKRFIESKTIKVRADQEWYHGAAGRFVDSILRTGEIVPRYDGEQSSGGLTTEREFTYFTPSLEAARQYAFGVETRNAHTIQPGAAFIMEAGFADDLRIIDWRSPLTPEEIEVVNTYLPQYKPMKEGEALDRFPWRTNNPSDFPVILKELGFNAYLQDENQLAIHGPVPVKLVRDYRGEKQIFSKPEPYVEPQKAPPTKAYKGFQI